MHHPLPCKRLEGKHTSTRSLNPDPFPPAVDQFLSMMSFEYSGESLAATVVCVFAILHIDKRGVSLAIAPLRSNICCVWICGIIGKVKTTFLPLGAKAF